MKVNCIIVDDNPNAIDLIADHISKISEFSVKLSTTKPIQALDYILDKKIDCVFLDIQMPELSGLEFIETLKERLGKEIPKIILTTGSDINSSQSFQYGVFDYLLKPVSFKRFKICAERIINEFSKEESGRKINNFFFIELDGKKVKLNYDDIYYIEAKGNYIYLTTKTERPSLYRSLNYIQSILPEERFVRVHKSYIVSLEHIDAIEKDDLLLKINGTTKRIPIGGTYKDDIYKRLRINC